MWLQFFYGFMLPIHNDLKCVVFLSNSAIVVPEKFTCQKPSHKNPQFLNIRNKLDLTI